MKKIAILYICTGKYAIFWNGFFKSMEQFFLPDCEKHYFVFTDQVLQPVTPNVHIIDQKYLGWPLDTLFRFHMFDRIIDRLNAFDYVFFLNANMLCVSQVSEEILPCNEPLVALLHPIISGKPRSCFTYETNPLSTAYIPDEKGKFYFMGAFNGGKAPAYIKLINTLAHNIEQDLRNGIVALWYDESHLNRYLLNRKVKKLSPAYGYAEGYDLPYEKKIVILDKNNFGGHAFLRNVSPTLPVT